jgi:hypothetical protein
MPYQQRTQDPDYFFAYNKTPLRLISKVPLFFTLYLNIVSPFIFSCDVKDKSYLNTESNSLEINEGNKVQSLTINKIKA